ncbi:MAG: hypothetical protein Fur0025_30270 [Oscillatoriaceae cyanobacterium]
MDYDVSSKVERRGILAGMLLGKGYRNQNNFYIQDAGDREEYLIFKKDILEQITGKPVSLQRWNSKNGQQLRLEPKLIPIIRVLVKKLYPGGTPKITPEFLEFLTPQGIAIWFMDKGSRSFKKKQGQIHALEIYLNTHLTKDANEVIVAYFSQKWGFKWGLSKTKTAYRLRMGTKEGKRFLTFVRPYVPETMLYKVETESAQSESHQALPTASNTTATT